MNKTIIFAATRNLYRDMIPSVNSAAKNSGADEIILLIEDNNYPYPLPENVWHLNVSRQPFINPNCANAKRRWTYMCLLKAALAHLFPHKDRVLMLDCDTITRHDLSELWELDMGDYYYGMVRQIDDGRGGRFGVPYYNAGVMLCNLDKLRDGKEDELIYVLHSHELAYPEQDAINERCRGQILELPPRYNVCKYNVKDPDRAEYINHYAADPNWRGFYGREYDL